MGCILLSKSGYLTWGYECEKSVTNNTAGSNGSFGIGY